MKTHESDLTVIQPVDVSLTPPGVQTRVSISEDPYDSDQIRHSMREELNESKQVEATIYCFLIG